MEIKKSNWLDEQIDQLNKDTNSLTFKYVLEFSEKIFSILDSKGIKNKNKYLAEKLNCSPAYITKLFNGKSNFTIKKLIELTKVVDYTLEINLRPNLRMIKTAAYEPEILKVSTRKNNYTPSDSFNKTVTEQNNEIITSELVA